METFIKVCEIIVVVGISTIFAYFFACAIMGDDGKYKF